MVTLYKADALQVRATPIEFPRRHAPSSSNPNVRETSAHRSCGEYRVPSHRHASRSPATRKPRAHPKSAREGRAFAARAAALPSPLGRNCRGSVCPTLMARGRNEDDTGLKKLTRCLGRFVNDDTCSRYSADDVQDRCPLQPTAAVFRTRKSPTRTRVA